MIGFMEVNMSTAFSWQEAYLSLCSRPTIAYWNCASKTRKPLLTNGFAIWTHRVPHISESKKPFLMRIPLLPRFAGN